MSCIYRKSSRNNWKREEVKRWVMSGLEVEIDINDPAALKEEIK